MAGNGSEWLRMDSADVGEFLDVVVKHLFWWSGVRMILCEWWCYSELLETPKIHMKENHFMKC